MINTGELTLLSSNGVFSTDLGRVQSFFLLICQSGLIFQQPITWMQPAQLQASLWEASDAELTAVVGRQTEPRCGTELQEAFEDIWRSACCSWARFKGCISDRAYLLPQPSNHFPDKSVPESQLLVLGNYLPLTCSPNRTPKKTIYSTNVNQALDTNPEIFHWAGSCLALTLI